MIRALAPAITVLLILAPVASAHHNPMMLPYPMTHVTAQAYRQAMTTWDTPCDGHVAINWVRIREPWVGRAYQHECLIELDAGFSTRTRSSDPALYCTLILHEVGHIAGYRPPAKHSNPRDIIHSTSPASVMFARLLHADKRCAWLRPRSPA